MTGERDLLRCGNGGRAPIRLSVSNWATSRRDERTLAVFRATRTDV